MHISGEKKPDPKPADVKPADPKPAAPHADPTPAAKVAPPAYDGPDRRVSGISERRLAPAGSWPIQLFPAWRYHATLGSKIVASQVEADALGAGWQATPIVRTPAK